MESYNLDNNNLIVSDIGEVVFDSDVVNINKIIGNGCKIIVTQDHSIT